jgi:hypothetical protein
MISSTERRFIMAKITGVKLADLYRCHYTEGWPRITELAERVEAGVKQGTLIQRKNALVKSLEKELTDAGLSEDEVKAEVDEQFPPMRSRGTTEANDLVQRILERRQAAVDQPSPEDFSEVES